ncbi:plasmid transfer protein TraB [Streptomyces sp. NBC_01500]|uniref:plasmid transfer protein TraB n=1 Tax=Streptomyces sp. NBC_01500 TaxID=2903886 RepID=UPI00225A557C|nr:plasmid transfer protein TraB [Streptomyces sp. NBC_01500]MCX4549458.1 plasmid transfer protein TraB [Streptomyces sp. NBC_01500]
MGEHDPEQQHEEHLKGGSSPSGLGAYILHRAKPHLPPWICVGGLGVAGGGANLMWSGSAGAAVGLTLASVALTGATWWAGKTTSQQRRLHSAITVAAGSAWLTGAALAGPLAGVLPDAFAMGGPVLALSWNIRMLMRRNPDATGQSADKGLLEKVGLAKAKIGRTEVEANRVTAALTLPAGEATNDDIARTLPRIASALDLPTTAVRYLPDPDSARRGDLVIVPRDMLADTVRWEENGPSHPGGSITDPLVIGVYDDGSPLLLWLPGDKNEGRNATHVLIAGMTGSGKGDGALNLMTEILSRTDAVMWLSDPKGFQDFRPLLPAIDWAVEGGPDTEVMVEAVKAVIPARTAWLGAHSYRQWEAAAAQKQTDPKHSCRKDGTACGCDGLPFHVAWFEEAGVSLGLLGDDAFNSIANLARSAGMALVVSLQRPSHDQISTTTRDALGARLCFGVPNATAAGFMLPDSVVDAGAAPERWSNRRPGYCYLITPGVPEERYSSPGRTRWFTDSALSLMETVAHWFARNGASVGHVTEKAAATVAGTAYTNRRSTAPADTDPDPESDGDDDEMTGTLIDPEDADIDPDRDLPESAPGDDTPMFGNPGGRKPSPEEARELFARALDEFEDAGQMVVGPKDFMDWCDRNSLSRPWVSARLKDAAMEGRLEPTSKTGRWRIVPALANA